MIRKAIAYTALPLFLILVLLAWLSPSHSPATATAPMPTVASTTYPPCATEDGAGQALCWWDAQAQGNGEGTSVLSGDCAAIVVGADNVWLCTNVHAQDSYTYEYQGATVTMPNGADRVGECVAEQGDVTDPETVAINADNGWTMRDCLTNSL